MLVEKWTNDLLCEDRLSVSAMFVWFVWSWTCMREADEAKINAHKNSIVLVYLLIHCSFLSVWKITIVGTVEVIGFAGYTALLLEVSSHYMLTCQQQCLMNNE